MQFECVIQDDWWRSFLGNPSTKFESKSLSVYAMTSYNLLNLSLYWTKNWKRWLKQFVACQVDLVAITVNEIMKRKVMHINSMYSLFTLECALERFLKDSSNKWTIFFPWQTKIQFNQNLDLCFLITGSANKGFFNKKRYIFIVQRHVNQWCHCNHCEWKKGECCKCISTSHHRHIYNHSVDHSTTLVLLSNIIVFLFVNKICLLCVY